MSETRKLPFASDYMTGAHPAILERLAATNLDPQPGYGDDAYSERACELVRAACEAPEAAVWFVSGGTQANAAVIGSLLASYQGVIAASTGHISVHEAGAIEYSGHKVIEIEGTDGKLDAAGVEAVACAYEADETRDHMVMPAMVYISQPSELGTLYSRAELEAIAAVCREHGLLLYLDGARLAYALACKENDVSLADLARLCDVFYIGGTKCGALLGEAIVMRDASLAPKFFSQLKQRGAVLAKGRLLGLQFETLFEDGLYFELGSSAIAAAECIRAELVASGYELASGSPTNQIFAVFDDAEFERLEEQVACETWERLDGARRVVRFVTSWSTSDEDVEALGRLLRERV